MVGRVNILNTPRMENRISLARWGVHGVLKVIVPFSPVFLFIVRILQVEVFYVETLPVWP